ncbi:hypothetical protein Poli38472_009038 [Pythium oligandrum]|uniref:Phosphodiesterase n=1 Tax=Pythium oligandrum TaxID=41045 RepID=A0A8K1CLG4_PYTOL|nr:hypothetical protein Poli38472_009038 [Pythium oligandrum]|eukprot:TMW64871.1 hypothetical protein Poli38472_009038 [Pythium oligandrum]
MLRGGFLSKRSVQVTPKRANSQRVIVVKQDVHPICGHFLNVNVEREFQKYYRSEIQSGVIVYMLAMIVFSILFTVGSGHDALAATLVYFAGITDPPTILRTASQRVSWFSNATQVTLVVVFPLFAFGCVVFLARYRNDLFWMTLRIDPMQLVLLIFYQFVLIPVMLATAACADLEDSYLDDFSAHGQGAWNKQTLAFLGTNALNIFYVFVFLATCVASCLLRMQFAYFLALATEFAIIVSALSGVAFPHLPIRWGLYIAFLLFLALLTRGVWDGELAHRREFLSQSSLINENRRLSNQNIEMKEELSGKLNYQLHYEMADILRILCQIKVKMNSHEKKEIDKIITALVSNEDLFEVSLDPSKTEHEEEVQGWLHMMALKESPASVHGRQSVDLGEDPGYSPRPILKAQVHRSTQSRRMSRNPENEDKAVEMLTKFYIKTVSEEPEDFSRWLLTSLLTDFFVDMFYIDEHCSAPLQAVLITCIEINDFIARLGLDCQKLLAFAGAIENHYFKRNPYHNCLHAGAVVADMHFYLRRITLTIDDITFFVGLITAAAHDISHPGVSNGFLIATRSKLAITYSDDSILERMHVAELYRILSHEKFDIFAHLDGPVKSDVRKLIIQMILATDLSRHFQHVSKIKSRKFVVTDNHQGLDVSWIMETMLMLSDLGHTTKPFAYHQLWANRIAEEFFRQGEAEERNNLPISPLCDRRVANLPRSQVAFLTLLATPLFEATGDALAIEEYNVVMTNLRGNIAAWQSLISRSDSVHNSHTTPRPSSVMKDRDISATELTPVVPAALNTSNG